MKIKLLEGKNKEQTFNQYKQKIIDSSPFDWGDKTESFARALFDSLMMLDPTYNENSTTTGDFGIWILNQFLKDNFVVDGVMTEPPYANVYKVLQDFIEKKSNLQNKDINSYKTPKQLFDVLSQIELTDRQKERKIRKDIKDAKYIGSAGGFDIYIPETYQASCALGKGSGWCTADSRTARYYNYYKDEYGGDYYILISKDGKNKYQFHFESDQYSAAGTNEDINTPNEEVMIDINQFYQDHPELKKFFESIGKLVPSDLMKDALLKFFDQYNLIDYIDEEDEEESEFISSIISTEQFLNLIGSSIFYRNTKSKTRTWFQKSSDISLIKALAPIQSLLMDKIVPYLRYKLDEPSLDLTDDQQNHIYNIWKKIYDRYFINTLVPLFFDKESNWFIYVNEERIFIKLPFDYVISEIVSDSYFREQFQKALGSNSVPEMLKEMIGNSKSQVFSYALQYCKSRLISQCNKIGSSIEAFYNSEKCTDIFYDLIQDYIESEFGVLIPM